MRNSSRGNARTRRIGIYGAGAVVEAAHLPVLLGIDGVHVAWICDVDLDRARRMARLFGIARAERTLASCPDVDIVLVAIPVGARREALTEVLARGAHAFCEKPFAANLADHRFIVNEARKCQRRLGVALMRRHFWSTKTAAGLVSAGILGRIESVIAGEGNRLQRTGRSADWYQASSSASGGGAMRETGSHTVDQAFSIFGAASYEFGRSKQVVFEGLEFETHAGATIIGVGGMRARFSVCVSRLRDTFNGICLRGASGELRVKLDADSPVELRSRNGRVVTRFPPSRSGAAAHLASIRDEWTQFLSAADVDHAFTDDDTGLLTTAFIDECYARPSAPSERPLEAIQ